MLHGERSSVHRCGRLCFRLTPGSAENGDVALDIGENADRPDAVPLDPETGKKLPLFAFSVLRSGDAFEMTAGKPPPNGRSRAEAYVAAKVRIHRYGAPEAMVSAVKKELVEQLAGNPQLVDRLQAARPIAVDLVPPKKKMADLGYPRRASASASGLFWDHPAWPEARMALLQDALGRERALVTHEMAHAIQRLGFTQAEQDAIYRLMLPVYQYRAWVDEVFAIYSEREFLPFFTEREGHAPGVYGMARQRWDERHVFTRFVRLLYFPYKPLAGTPAADRSGRLG